MSDRPRGRFFGNSPNKTPRNCHALGASAREHYSRSSLKRKFSAAWVVELLDDGAHLVGHSFGGCVALAAAAKRPAAVRSLTVIEPAMHKLATNDPRVRRFVLSVLVAMLFSTSAARRAKRFMKLVGVPSELRGPSDPEELKRLGQGLARGRIPSKATLQRELGEIKRAGIPLLVVTGGWNPAFEATADIVAETGGGRRAVIKSEHHFPQAVSDEFNQILASSFMEKSDGNARHPLNSPS